MTQRSSFHYPLPAHHQIPLTLSLRLEKNRTILIHSSSFWALSISCWKFTYLKFVKYNIIITIRRHGHLLSLRFANLAPTNKQDNWDGCLALTDLAAFDQDMQLISGLLFWNWTTFRLTWLCTWYSEEVFSGPLGIKHEKWPKTVKKIELGGAT